jgi:MoaA/NifB/PqqE/SkfB family radical SAM enzyme
MNKPPEFLFLSINEHCNLHCRHCDYWKMTRPSLLATSLPRQAEILGEFAQLTPRGKVVICGGEPTLDTGAYFETCRISRSLDLTTLSVTNGSTITTPDDADRMIQDGPDEISISLDGHDAAVHDRTRGTKGAFVEANRALSLLLKARDQSKSGWIARKRPKIYAMGLLTSSTCHHLDDFYELVLAKIGADKLKLNAVQPSFLNTRSEQQRDYDRFFEIESQVDPDTLLKDLVYCDEKWKLNLNPTWIDQVVSYFRDLWQTPDLQKGWNGGFRTSEHLCNSYDRNIMVDVLGRASLCFSTAFPSRKLEKPGDLQKFWETPGCRGEMNECRSLCGISHSVRQAHATRRSNE